jgi:hypothetical protein
VKLTTHLHLMPRSRMVELNLHSPMCFRGTGSTSPYTFVFLYFSIYYSCPQWVVWWLLFTKQPNVRSRTLFSLLPHLPLQLCRGDALCSNAVHFQDPFSFKLWIVYGLKWGCPYVCRVKWSEWPSEDTSVVPCHNAKILKLWVAIQCQLL